jgi:hypothetical protein
LIVVQILLKKIGRIEGLTLNTLHENVKRAPRSGRPHKYNMLEMREHVRAIPLKQRKTVRGLAAGLSISRATAYRMMENKDNGFRRHSSALKPHLKEVNKVERVFYALSKVGGECFKDMEDEIHVNEKWFYLTNNNENYIMLDDEEDPERTVQHKSHIDKVMFLAATAKPRWDPHNRQMWDGKVGLWPFARLQPAQCNSDNRPAGTLEWKNYNVNRDAYRAMLIDNVLPAIQEKWPRGTLQEVKRIQQDNAPLHIKGDDPLWLAAVAASGLQVEIYNQPPNSPDTNINDLAFFVSIQTLQHRIGSGNNKNTLIESVIQAYNQYPWKSMRNAF